ncbi:MAG: thioredoxin domain-containing protein [Ferruginibacter sp.]
MKNELSTETSPYLLQHAHNPVHWQPWSTKALQLAEELDKPILVSIGYSACHWCHVMERESFEVNATAAIMNEHFINIKIDREERPDIDHIYMDAVQAMTGSGGWPLNVFLTPEGKPFYGGTYFPPVKAYGRASWTDVLLSIAEGWKNNKEKMLEQAETLTKHLEKSNNIAQLQNAVNLGEAKAFFTKEDCKTITENLLASADTVEGGFGKAPKFPQTFSINCLLQSAYFLKDEKALEQAELSLNKMLNGGIYDQLAGGLCRYSTDGEWLAPHFEKMLYDNALFIVALSNAFLLTKKEDYKNAVQHVCAFIMSEMKNSNGGYYAAIDADSEGVEGKFYVWDKADTDKLLGDDAALFNDYFDVTESGNWEEKNILRVLRPLEDVAASFNMPVESAILFINRAKKKLLDVRNTRVRPGTDDKILLGWNALLLTAFCKAYAILQDDIYKNAAIALYDFIEEKFAKENNSYFHTYKSGEAKYPAFLDDYSYYAEACIHLQEITADEKYLHNAKKITEYVFENFHDKKSGFFFFTEENQEDIIVRKIEVYDGATPSANAVMAKNLLYLSLVFDKREWQEKAGFMIDSLNIIIKKHPGSFGLWAATAMNKAAGINEIVLTSNDVIPSLKNVLLQYLPNKVLQANFNISIMPLLKDRTILQELSIYLCRNFTCTPALASVNELLHEIQEQSF